jgi:D-arabinose 1-dehydrogenase-like Zn-dependent alcohol dehydrogenase
MSIATVSKSGVPKLTPQLIPGHEAVGTVVDMGSKVTGFVKGDRVAADVGGQFLP